MISGVICTDGSAPVDRPSAGRDCKQGRDTMRTHARVVVIGGGVGGVSILYHLAKKGWSDVVLTADLHGGTPVF